LGRAGGRLGRIRIRPVLVGAVDDPREDHDSDERHGGPPDAAIGIGGWGLAIRQVHRGNAKQLSLRPASLVAPIALALLDDSLGTLAPVDSERTADLIGFLESARLAAPDKPLVAPVWLDEFSWHCLHSLLIVHV
jgi:hypothetical protein